MLVYVTLLHLPKDVTTRQYFFAVRLMCSRHQSYNFKAHSKAPITHKRALLFKETWARNSCSGDKANDMTHKTRQPYRHAHGRTSALFPPQGSYILVHFPRSVIPPSHSNSPAPDANTEHAQPWSWEACATSLARKPCEDLLMKTNTPFETYRVVQWILKLRGALGNVHSTV